MDVNVELLRADQVREFIQRVYAIRHPGGATPWGSAYGLVWDKLAGLIGGVNDLNRDMSRARVEEYAETMKQGKWWFTPDPVVVTTEGFVINGQHRLAAAGLVEWNGDEVPRFVVVWGVDKRAAILMDEAKRSTDDRRSIAIRYATAADGGLAPIAAPQFDLLAHEGQTPDTRSSRSPRRSEGEWMDHPKKDDGAG